MAAGYAKYGAWFKQRVVEAYRGGMHGGSARAIAKHYELPCHKLVTQWHAAFHGTSQSLEKKCAGGRKRKLEDEEAQTHVKEFIENANKRGKAVSYADVHREVKQQTGKTMSLRTIQRVGRRDFNITDKMTTRKLEIEGFQPLICPTPTMPLYTWPDWPGVVRRNEGILGRHCAPTQASSASGYGQASVSLIRVKSN